MHIMYVCVCDTAGPRVRLQAIPTMQIHSTMQVRYVLFSTLSHTCNTPLQYPFFNKAMYTVEFLQKNTLEMDNYVV